MKNTWKKWSRIGVFCYGYNWYELYFRTNPRTATTEYKKVPIPSGAGAVVVEWRKEFMTEEQLMTFQNALKTVRIDCDTMHTELVAKTYEAVMKNGASLTVGDLVKIEASVLNRYKSHEKLE